MSGPLEGIVVVDVTQGLGGPYCAMLLGDAGARVIKVEPPSGDAARGYGPPLRGGDSAQFVEINRNKEGIALDLERPEGMECYLMTGDSDYLLRVVVPDLEAYERFVMDFTKIAGIAQIRSSFALRPVKQGTALPLGVSRDR